MGVLCEVIASLLFGVFESWLQRIWYTARQSIASNSQLGQIGEGAQFRRKGARQSVASELHDQQLGEVTQLPRDVARQLVVVEAQRQ